MVHGRRDRDAATVTEDETEDGRMGGWLTALDGVDPWVAYGVLVRIVVGRSATRWTDLGRALLPFEVGAGRRHSWSSTVGTVLGGVAWVLAFALRGRWTGTSGEALLRGVGQIVPSATGVVAAALGVVWIVKRRGRRRRARAAGLVESQGTDVVAPWRASRA